MGNGIFITFEGGEGCGKSSHIKMLAQHLGDLGKECVVTREPGGTALSERIRDLLLHAKEGSGMSARAEILLFEAARAQHVDQLIKPALDAGKIVLCDRFFDSTTAYQGVARKLNMQDVLALNNFATAGLTPDITIVLDIPAKTGIERANARDANGSDRMGSEKIEFYESVRAAFLKLVADQPERFAVVDTGADKETAFSGILKVLSSRGIL